MTTLRDKMKQEMTLRGFSPSTQDVYLRSVVIGSSGKALCTRSIGAMYSRSKKIAGINKQGGAHGLRHAFATHALEAGVDLYTIKQLLGHASITSTARYLRMTEKTLQSIQSPVEQLSL